MSTTNKQPLKKAQRDDIKSLSIGLIGGAYVVIGDKVGSLLGVCLAMGSNLDPAVVGSVCSILFSLIAIAIGLHHFKKVNKK